MKEEKPVFIQYSPKDKVPYLGEPPLGFNLKYLVKRMPMKIVKTETYVSRIIDKFTNHLN